MTPPRDRFLPPGDGAGHYRDFGAATPILRAAALTYVAAAAMSFSSVSVIGNALRLRSARI